jgi:uncharacterized protein (DUF433 family)
VLAPRLGVTADRPAGVSAGVQRGGHPAVAPSYTDRAQTGMLQAGAWERAIIGFDNRIRTVEGMSDLLERITIDPEICHGKPCICGLRYPVEVIFELLSAGSTVDEILRDYEDLEREDVLAALAFAARRRAIQSPGRSSAP